MNKPTLFQTFVFLAMAAALIIGEVRHEGHVDAMKLEVNRLDNQIRDLIGAHFNQEAAISAAGMAMTRNFGRPDQAAYFESRMNHNTAMADWVFAGGIGPEPAPFTNTMPGL